MVQGDISLGQRDVSVNTAWFGSLILFLLLALELADRVTMKRDLEIAREIQQWLVPDKPPAVAGIDIAFATRPRNTVARDYYDAFMRPVSAGDALAYPLLVVVADVAGKSVPAALLMATRRACARSRPLRRISRKSWSGSTATAARTASTATASPPR